MVESHRACDVRTVEAGDEQVEGAVIGVGEETRRQSERAQILLPFGRCEFEFRPRQPNVCQDHAHRARRRVERIPALRQLHAHRVVALVNPGREACDGGLGIDILERHDG
jgi:hypothetical protein